jgi:hypothetical protein
MALGNSQEFKTWEEKHKDWYGNFNVARSTKTDFITGVYTKNKTVQLEWKLAETTEDTNDQFARNNFTIYNLFPPLETTSYYSVIADLHTLQMATAPAKSTEYNCVFRVVLTINSIIYPKHT